MTERGLHCPAGDFYVDPWQEVERAIVTHAHADHARPGSRHYLTSRSGESVLRLRMGPEANIQGLDYGETLIEATRREAREETGYEIEVGRLIIVCEAIEPGGRHIVNLVFTGEITGGELAVGQNDKSLRDAAWQPRSALTRLPMFPPIGEVIEESWQENFKGDVKVLGNVWKPLSDTATA